MEEKHFVYTAHHKMREIISDNNLLLMAISRFGIPFGFGDHTIRDICVANKVDVNTFLAVCNLISGQQWDDYNVALPTLMDYLRRAHAGFLGYTLPKIRYKLIEAINYSETNDVAFQLIKFFDDYVLEVKRHTDYENDVIFAYAGRLLEGEIDEDFRIARFSASHSHITTKLQQLKNIFIYHFRQRENVALSSALFDIIMCEKDLMSHCEIENRLFVPAVMALENSLRSMLSAENGNDAEGESNEDERLALLSEREKEIIRHVACGLSNKEIADRLFLSVHTVATHRRNIAAKLEIHSSAGLTIFALLHHLIELEEVSTCP